MPTTTTCRQCGKDFPWKRAVRVCSDECRLARRLEYQGAYQLRTYHELRAAAVEKLGGTCACGATERLEIHHVHGGGDQDRAKRSRNGVLRAVAAGEPGFALLCRPCHLESHA
jgi:hypothetical protein